MRIFRDMRGGQFKPGPGVNEPPPAFGFSRSWFILRNHPGKMIKGNVLFVLLSLPIITAPAAYCGLNAVISKLMTSGHSYPFMDFVDGAKRRFWLKTFFGLPFFVVIVGTVILLRNGVKGVILYASIAVAVVFFFASCSFFATVNEEGAEIPALFLRSFASCISPKRIIRCMPSLLIAASFSVFGFSLFPILLLIGMSLIALLSQAGNCST